MVTIRCTTKLLVKLGIKSRPPETPPPDNILGDWYATYLNVRPSNLVVLISERSNLAVVLEARPIKTFAHRFLPSLAEVLRYVGIKESSIENELIATSVNTFGPATNRKTLGYLNQITLDMLYVMYDHPEFTPDDWSKDCAERMFSNPYRYPYEVTQELFTTKEIFTLMQGGNA